MKMASFAFNRPLLLFLGTLVLVILVEAGPGHRQKYGDICNRSKKCDFTKWLRCKEGRCICFDEPLLFYDNTTRCVGRAGTNCSRTFYPFDDLEPALFHMRGQTANHWRYGNSTLRCGPNAFCAYDGVEHECRCIRSYYDDEGHCFRMKSHGDSCTRDKECNPDMFIKCIDGTCQCDKPRVYNNDLYKCVVKAHEACVALKNKYDGRQADDCPHLSVCNNGICDCEPGTQLHSDHTCQKGYGKECGLPEHPCGDSKLTCRNKMCQCKYPLHQEYDESVAQCLSLAGGPCSTNETSDADIRCTANADCVRRGLHMECRCREGFLQTESGECVKPYGSICDEDADCDRVPPLACVNNKCDCPDLLQTYDVDKRTCLGLVGARCKMGEMSCIENAGCTKFEGQNYGQIKFGRCMCNNAFLELESRTCARGR